MAREASPRGVRSALYATLLEVAESEAQHAMPMPGNAARLTALRAGQPVDVAAGDLPDWARTGESTHWWRRAIVTATGAVGFYDDDGHRWLEDQGL